MNNIIIPKQLKQLQEAVLFGDTKSDIIERAIMAITGTKCRKDEIEVVRILIDGIKPRDSIEAFRAAQFVAAHVIGTRMLSHPYEDDQKLGLKLLKFSNEIALKLRMGLQ